MRKNLTTALDLLGLEERGYQNDPLDRGNWVDGKLIGTNHGVSAKALAAWMGSRPSVVDMKNLDRDVARMIFTNVYWMPYGNTLPSGLDLAYFDMAVNAGVPQATKALQRALRVHDDGIFGGLTALAVIRHSHPIALRRIIHTYSKERTAFNQRLRNWKRFGKGWSARVGRITTAALDLVA